MLRVFLLFAVCSIATPRIASADLVISAFGPNGQGGSNNGQTFTFGGAGNVYEIDAFVNIAGFDLNGATVGTSGQVSSDALPAGVTFSFGHELSADNSDIFLTYSINNQSGSLLNNLQFFSFVDSEIDVASNDYFNEYATTTGTLGSGAGDDQPDSFEVDEPGFVFGDIFDNLRIGSLDNTNNVDDTFPDDVSMALGFDIGNLEHQQLATFTISLSEDGDSLSSFFIQHLDSDAASPDALTFSGTAAVTSSVPEPSSLILLGLTSLFCLRRTRSKDN